MQNTGYHLVQSSGRKVYGSQGEYKVLSRTAIWEAGRSAIDVLGMKGLFLFLVGLKVREDWARGVEWLGPW